MNRRLFISLILIVCLGLVGAAVVGYITKPVGFDLGGWAEIAIAIGTMLLALATAWLAFEANAGLEHSRRLAEIQDRDETRKDQAWIFIREAMVALPNGTANPNSGIASVEIVNAGHGPAIEVAVSLEVWEKREPGSGRSVIAVKTLPLMMPMSAEKVQIMPTLGVRFDFDADASSLTCAYVRYRDKTTSTGSFREAGPFWELTPTQIADYYDVNKIAKADHEPTASEPEGWTRLLRAWRQRHSRTTE
jgi:hypothetical protein